ncbi:class I glutamine amidotransferase-like protein [Rhizodiscina lignyota]|uniref:Class I glutamine amidotransferase-like protein n=1 Tax=Rhizodiscina lignyota TaxID=1504668 RepID=A0A9P4IA13_9PEZI|nr:class I glutamine amidotransferase-like protein [Rhizodiscina lignyota]
MAPIHWGALAFDYQVLDVLGPFDLLNSSSQFLLNAINDNFHPVDEKALARAPEFVFHHIGLTRDPVHLLTSELTIVPSTTLDECPELDCLLIGGANPIGFEFPPEYIEFIRRHVAAGKLLFTNCTGASHVAATGVLDGKNATVNNQEFEWVKKQFPKVKWTKEKKWIIDGNIWTGSGAVAGMDMISHWLKENFGLDVLIAGSSGLDFEPRNNDGLFEVLPQRYDSNGKHISTHVL